jgi:hypothetical protein
MSNFKLLKVTSNSVDLQWENIGPDCLYQITRAEVEVLKFDIVYEGRELGIHLENLKPLTKYKFILRTSDSAEHIVWKHDAQEIQVHTQGIYF